MSADASADPAAPHLNLTHEEKRVFGDLFKQADPENLRIVTGDAALGFFDKTRLDSRILGEIWQIADKENRGFLTPAGFSVVLRLIGHAQAGREPRPELAFQQGPLPRFDGIHVPGMPVSPPPASPSGIPPQGTGAGAARIPPLTPDKVSQYATLFERQPLQNNMLGGEHAREIFDKSGLPNETLGRIWALADTEQRGALVLAEFVIAMHLLTSIKTGALRGLPNVLPAGLYEAATQRAPAVGSRQPQATMSAIPRQMSGSTQPRTGSPLGRPPMSPQGTGVPAAGEWAISPTDKERFDQIYATLDKTNKGYITGNEAVPFFSQSNLSENALAQIWDLADFHSQGQLTAEGFAIAMYLIRQQRSGRAAALPTTLPANLVPPSVRNQPRPTVPAFEAPLVAQPPPPQPKSAIEDLFGLDTSTSSPTSAAPPQLHMSTGGSNSNDPFSAGQGVLSPSSPVRSPSANTGFKPFVPSSSFGRGLTAHPTGEGAPSAPKPAPSEDLLDDNDPEASKKISGETAELANLSNQIGALSKQTQEVQNKRNNTQTELNQTNSQKRNFEQRLAQLRALYEKEREDTRALEEQLRKSRSETQKLQAECMSVEGSYKDSQAQHQQLAAALQADQQEIASLRERIKAVNSEVAQLKPQIEKLKSDARQQKGLVAIHKKQLATTEGEREKLKTEAKEVEEGIRHNDSSSPASTSAQVASPALSTVSGNNPFFKRTASTDMIGAFAPRAVPDKSFDDVFGPSFMAGATPPSAPAPAFKQQNTGNSAASAASYNTASSTPNISRQASMAAEPPPPPESKQINSSFLPFPDRAESLSSSRQVSPPASRVEDPSNASSHAFTGEQATMGAATVAASSPAEDTEKSETASATTPVPGGVRGPSTADSTAQEEPVAAGPSGAFGVKDEAKAKADFDNAFAAFSASKSHGADMSHRAKNQSSFDAEFPPIMKLERDDDDDSDTESENDGFEDNFAPPAPSAPLPDASDDRHQTKAEPSNSEDSVIGEALTTATSEPEMAPPQAVSKSVEHAASPTTITNPSATAPKKPSTADDIFGSSATMPSNSSSAAAAAHSTLKGAFDDVDDEFEGLEDAKEGSADDEFANISRDDYNPVFDSSPPASQAKSESTAFGNESSFDFVSPNQPSVAPAAAGGGGQAKTAENHDWDALFAGLDSPSTVPGIHHPGVGGKGDEDGEARPSAPGRALTEQGEHDDPMVKNLTNMGYKRADVVAALEKYDYNLHRAANHLASQN
ncbi:hypothetical protein CDD82_647 [Ophiocordyceps australis]|uniref:UBA domain-containing protein n=1 Tax=Ophiocordyceps australis TaxID=1399860 RepID=A0A2C5ZNU2_9HYPO|nr:hypothetical protein CDD82_647 [Ophiocordyceps australis]